MFSNNLFDRKFKFINVLLFNAFIIIFSDILIVFVVVLLKFTMQSITPSVTGQLSNDAPAFVILIDVNTIHQIAWKKETQTLFTFQESIIWNPDVSQEKYYFDTDDYSLTVRDLTPEDEATYYYTVIQKDTFYTVDLNYALILIGKKIHFCAIARWLNVYLRISICK